MARTASPADRAETPPHPRITHVLFGHEDAQQALLDAYRGGRIHHAWLIGGPRGIGKATLAYRMARFVFAHPDPSSAAAASSLAVAAEDPVARRVAAQAHSDLLVLERIADDKGKLRTVITVDQARRSIGFFGATAGEGGWRIAIIDSADELHPSAANALLKVLEEPPPRSLFLIVSHAPGRLLATIRSRCRRLDLRPLAPDDVARATAAATGGDARDPAIVKAAAAAGGSVARALLLLGGPALGVRDQVVTLLDALPAVDASALHALGDALGGPADDTALAAFADAVHDWLWARFDAEPHDLSRLARVAEVWDKINDAVRNTDVHNLDRKPLVFAVFGLLAETAR